MKNKEFVTNILVIALTIAFFSTVGIATTFKEKYHKVNKAYKSCLNYQEKMNNMNKKKQVEQSNLVVYRYNSDNSVADVYKLHNIITYYINNKTLTVKSSSETLTLQGNFTLIECNKDSKAWSKAVEYHKDTDGHDYAYYFNKKHSKRLPENDAVFSDL